MRKVLLNQMEQEMTCMMNEFISEMKSLESPEKKWCSGVPSEKMKKKKLHIGPLPHKEFTNRNSLLTELLEIDHIQTIYHVFIAILILLFINTVIEDLVDKGRIDLDFELIQWNFGNFRTVLITWVCGFHAILVTFILSATVCLSRK